jgi:hypothetical protein
VEEQANREVGGERPEITSPVVFDDTLPRKGRENQSLPSGGGRLCSSPGEVGDDGLFYSE